MEELILLLLLRVVLELKFEEGALSWGVCVRVAVLAATEEEWVEERVCGAARQRRERTRGLSLLLARPFNQPRAQLPSNTLNSTSPLQAHLLNLAVMLHGAEWLGKKYASLAGPGKQQNLDTALNTLASRLTDTPSTELPPLQDRKAA